MNAFKLWYRSQPVALRTIITVNVAIFVAWYVFLKHIPFTYGLFINHLALNPDLPGVLLEAWQLVTYNFLHLGDFFHILFNMLWLWWIGKEYEQMHGAPQMFALYVISGIGGGLLSVLWYAATPGSAVIYGASASVLGLMAAVVTLYPQKRIGLFLFGAVRLLWVIVAFLALDVLFMATSNTAVMAHLGGAAGGFLFVRGQQRGLDLSSWAKLFFSGNRSSSSGYVPRGGFGGSSFGSGSGASSGGGVFGRLFGGGGGGERSSPGRRSERETLREERDRKKRHQNARRREVDRILDKISAEGYEALSDDEKRTLESASGD